MKYFKYWCAIIVLLFLFKPFGTAQLTVKGLLHIQDEALVYVEPDLKIETAEGSVENNGTLSLEGNIEKEAVASFSPTDKKGQVSLLGQESVQRITGDFTGVNSFYDLVINKPTGMVELNSSIEVQNSFNLAKGKIRTDIDAGSESSDYQYELYISNPTPNALAGNTSVASSTNYIEGNLRRAVAGLGNYTFPIGQTENNPVSISFRQAAPVSTINAFFGVGTVTSVGSTFNCTDNNIDATSIGCALGKWDIQGSASNYDYDINFSPSETLLKDCPTSNAFFVAKDGAFDCQADANLNNGISSTYSGSFGVFDLPTIPIATGGSCASPAPTTVTSISSNLVEVGWEGVPTAESYLFQIRFKGMTGWLITYPTPRTKVFVSAPFSIYEYRVKTICATGESEYTAVGEFTIASKGNLSSADARSSEKEIDIDLSTFTPSFTLFPNPVVDQLQVNYLPTSEASLSVYHVNGKLISETLLPVDQGIHIVNMTDLLAGFYIVSIKEKGRQITTRSITKLDNR